MGRFDNNLCPAERLIIKFANPANENLKKLFSAVAAPKLTETSCKDSLNSDVELKLTP